MFFTMPQSKTGLISKKMNPILINDNCTLSCNYNFLSACYFVVNV